MKRLLLAALLTIPLATAPALASPTAQVAGGQTTVELSDEFVDALGSLGVTPSAIAPGRLSLRKGRVSYPIPGGALDLESLKGDIFHTGGLVLEVPGTKVSLLNFIISTTGEAPVLTGLAAVNGDVVDRIPLFDLELTSDPQLTKWGGLKIKDVIVTLNAVGAETLNTVFGVDAFNEGLLIGTASVKTRIFGADDHSDDDSSDDDH
jgi:hypothetical protein